MYCVLVTGMPASGKTRLSEYLSCRLSLPVLSKDRAKEILFDDVGFHSRKEKVALGIAAMDLCYYFAESLTKLEIPFLLENNFESASRPGLEALLRKYDCTPVTVFLTGDYETIYRRFLERDLSPDRHRGHVVNTCYPEPEGGGPHMFRLRWNSLWRASTNGAWQTLIWAASELRWTPSIFPRWITRLLQDGWKKP